MALHLTLRPTLLKQVVGHNEQIKILQRKLRDKELPHVVLLSGDSGVGKTTIGRILATKIGCPPEIDGDMNPDYEEINASSTRGIDAIRDIDRLARMSPLGANRAWLIDECHALTKEAQNAFLKLLEDTPKRVYFFLATTIPSKLLRTIRGRCLHIALSPISLDALEGLVISALAQMKKKLSKEIIEKIAEVADGSAREALILTETLTSLDSQKEMEKVLNVEATSQGIELCRSLFRPGDDWGDVAKLLKTIDGEVETIRRAVIGYASSVALSNGRATKFAGAVLNAFECNFFDSGKGGLIRACMDVKGP